ncbi:MAG: DUF4290 domain-containing protein [Bacteroidia bacterium]|nr:DUF4290 domain-containing protein [Bacteroidia bacterium]MCZ2248767.1 DUF4290 domain-containing protein [Bacteroidia bacterium]
MNTQNLLEYNTDLSPLIIPEYGRNIQKMVNYAITIKDRDERNKAALAIIDVMGQLNPHLRDVVDFKHKLWDHLFVISKFQLDVDSPYPKPNPETFNTKPQQVAYPRNNIKYKHYGKVVEDMIQSAIEMEEGEMKDAFLEIIANIMKSFYITWNKDNVSDEVIVEQFNTLSKGQLKLKEGIKLMAKNDLNPRNTQQSGYNNNNGMSKKKKKFQKKKY